MKEVIETIDFRRDDDARSYQLPGRCDNCGKTFDVLLSYGQRRPSFYQGLLCTACGCLNVRVASPTWTKAS